MTDRPVIPIWPPVEGHYATRLTRGGPRVPVRIWFGQPIIDGELQDRSPRWCVEIDGKTDRVVKDEETGAFCTVPLDVEMAWPFCARDPVKPHEYRFLVSDAEHAREHRPEHPKANPRQAVDFNTIPLPF